MPRPKKSVRPDIEEMEQAETLVATLAPDPGPEKSNDSPQGQEGPTYIEGAEPAPTPRIPDGSPEAPHFVTGMTIVKSPGEEEVRMAPPAEEFPPVIQKALDGFKIEVIEEQIKTLRERVRVSADADAPTILQAIIDGKWSRKVMMLTPFNRPINPHAHYVMMAHLRRNPWMGYHYESDTIIQRARNILAHRFLESEAEWSWWVDQDTIAPFGDPGTFYHRFGADPTKLPPEFTGIQTLPKLLEHQKTIVGAVYAQRKPNGKLVIQPDIHSRGKDDEALVKRLRTKGPFKSLVEVEYVATGCALVHRKVYESIKEQMPNLAPKHENEPWNFFGKDVESSGEDIHFGRLAKAAGHKSFLDTAVVCGHLGDNVFFP